MLAPPLQQAPGLPPVTETTARAVGTCLDLLCHPEHGPDCAAVGDIPACMVVSPVTHGSLRRLQQQLSKDPVRVQRPLQQGLVLRWHAALAGEVPVPLDEVPHLSGTLPELRGLCQNHLLGFLQQLLLQRLRATVFGGLCPRTPQPHFGHDEGSSPPRPCRPEASVPPEALLGGPGAPAVASLSIQKTYSQDLGVTAAQGHTSRPRGSAGPGHVGRGVLFSNVSPHGSCRSSTCWQGGLSVSSPVPGGGQLHSTG